VAEAGNAVFRAIADFAAARREARGFSKDLSGIKGEAKEADRALDNLEGGAKTAAGALDKAGDAASRAKRQTSSYGREVLQTAAKVTLLHRAVDGLHRAMRSATATVWAARIRAAGRAAQDAYNNLNYFRRAVDRTDASSRRMIGTLFRMVAVLAAVSVATTALTSGAGGILSLLGAAWALSGVLGVLPGVLGLFGAGLAAVVIGMQGFGDALKAVASGDAAAFEESLKKLTPAAAATARAIWDMRPAFAAIKKSVQEALFKDLAPIVRNLGERYLPLMGRMLTSVAGSLNAAGRQVGAFLNEGRRVADVDRVFKSIEETARRLIPVGVNLTSAFLDFAVVGSEVMTEYAGGIANATGRFREFIREARESGRLGEWIRDGIETMKTLGSIVGNLGSILHSAFNAGKDAGYSFLEGLDRLTERLARFFKSAEGQTALVGFFRAASEAGRALAPVLEEIFRVIGKVAPILSDLGIRIAPGLKDAIHGLGVAFETARPGLQQLADAVGRFLSALGNSGPLIGAIANGVSAVLTPAINALAAGLWLLTTFFNGLPQPVQSLIGGLFGLVVVGGLAFVMFGKLISVAKTLQQTYIALKAVSAALGLTGGLSAIMAALTGITARATAATLAMGRLFAAAVLSGLTSVGVALRAVSLALLGVTTQAGLALLGLLRMTGAALLTGLTALATGIRVVATAMWAMTAAALANPIILIATAIALIAFLIIANWDTLKVWFSDFWGWLKTTSSEAAESVKNWFSAKWTELWENTKRDWEGIKTAVGGAMDWINAKGTQAGEATKAAISTKWSELWANTKRDWDSIKSNVGGALDWIGTKAREGGEAVSSNTSSAWQRAKDAVVSKGEEIGAYVSTLPGKIHRGLGNLGSLLWSAGQDVVRGFMNGLISLIGSLAATAARLAKAALDGAKRALGIGSPSKEFGEVGEDSMEGWIQALLGEKDRIVAAVRDLASASTRALKDEAKDMVATWARAVHDIARKRAALAPRSPSSAGMVRAEDGSMVSKSFYDKPVTKPSQARLDYLAAEQTRSLQDRLGSMQALRAQLAGMRVPDVNVSTGVNAGGEGKTTEVTVIFNVTNPLPETSSDTASREMRTLAQMGAFG